LDHNGNCQNIPQSRPCSSDASRVQIQKTGLAKCGFARQLGYRKNIVKLFEELGALIERRWRDQNYAENVFPGIAAQSLSESNLCDRVDPWEIVRWVHSASTLPDQMDLQAKFGNPPITLYAGPRFHIDVYYWLDGTTTIHQHAFSGAFQVLQGSSVHAGYEFAVDREINPHFLTGKLSFRDVSLLARDDIREIHPGPEFIHSLFHLDRPSVTITIRTYKAPNFARQYSYLKPHLAINSFFIDELQVRRVQTVSLLLRARHSEADKFVGELVESLDFHTAYAALREAFDFLCHRELEEIVGSTRSRDRFAALLDRARRKHGDLADLLEPVFEEEWRQADIIRRRAEIKSEEHRFLLALLLNVPERTRMLELVKEKFPEAEAIDLVVSWVRELSGMRTFGSKEPSVLGRQQLIDGHFIVLKRLLAGLTVERIKACAASEVQLTNGGPPIEEMVDHLKALPMFKGILSAN